jgi:S-adenosyl methyltransferase
VTPTGPSAGHENSGDAAATPATDPTFDVSVAHIARVYDYWLGGKDNFAADRAAGDQAIAAYPDIVYSVRANRAFLARAVGYLATEAGIRQFLDIGTGIPTANNTHEVAQEAAPACRVVYVDNDPIVLSHARALLASKPEGATSYIDADLRDTGQIIRQAATMLDFSQPVAVMLMAILQHLDDGDHPYDVVAELLAAVPPGSYLGLTHPASDIATEQMREVAQRLNKLLAEKVTLRGHDEVTRFFDGLDLVEPGMVRVQEWRPRTLAEANSPAALWCGVARKSA